MAEVEKRGGGTGCAYCTWYELPRTAINKTEPSSMHLVSVTTQIVISRRVSRLVRRLEGAGRGGGGVGGGRLRLMAWDRDKARTRLRRKRTNM